MLNYNVLNRYVELLKKNRMTVVTTTDNIKALTTADINKLKAGDIVLKNDSTGKHAYIVSYKKNGTGICLTYSDATYTETISYDYNSVTKEWIYNSMDSTELVSKSYVDSLMSGALKRAIVETLPTEDIDTNTIYMVLDGGSSQQGNVYNEYMYISNSWELIGTTATTSVNLYMHNINIYYTSSSATLYLRCSVITNSNTPFTKASFCQFLYNNSLGVVMANGTEYKNDLSEKYFIDGVTASNASTYQISRFDEGIGETTYDFGATSSNTILGDTVSPALNTIIS